MPLDEFQKDIAAALSANRNTGSPFAGGAVIQRHGFRLSNDQDIFTGWDLEDIAERDIATLEGAGYTVSRGLVLDRLPEGRYGRLQVTSEGFAAVSRDDAPEGRWIAPQPGGCMPSFDGIDREMIAGLIAEYGREGSRYTQDGGDGFTGGA